MDVPSNIDARRRISFFSNSLFMDMPAAPKVRNMLSFSVLTPYYTEEVLFSLQELEEPNEDGVSILFYLQKIFPDEWNNFLERVERNNEEELKESPELQEKLRLWASYRGQTLTRTVRGMMYYREALELQAFLDMAKHEDLMEGYKAIELNTEDSKENRSLKAQCEAVADMKFTYVVSCQQYGIQKRSGSERAQDILRLMTKYPSLRVAYIDEIEQRSEDRSKKLNGKVNYFSVLVRAVPKSIDSSEQNLDQEIYRIKLPGPAILGEGKPENQNHAIIFTRGEGLQTIDMNQDNYMEEALKMRNLLQEFLKKHDGVVDTLLFGAVFLLSRGLCQIRRPVLLLLVSDFRGMMYYREALELQAFLDMAKHEDLMEGYKAIELNTEDSEENRSLKAQCEAVADMKFMYVVSCQQYGIQKRSGSERAQDILRLMTKYPSLRVAYIDEIEQRSEDRSKKLNGKVNYFSVLVRAVPKSFDSSEQNLDQITERYHLKYAFSSRGSFKRLDLLLLEIYRIKLPGPAILGEGKPENQNHAIIFTRGEGLQTIDMNQDNYMEEALKMRNLLQEFLKKHDGVRYPTILGLREHIFTGSVSSLAWFMSNQETSFVTIGQRLLANPLKVRFHYGHPDVFDRLFHLTRGGVSKASKVINLSEDIFAGFNSTLREGNVTHHEYIQVGKGRDVGLNQISMFEAKIANGNGEQTLSRDIYRLGHRFDFFRMLSCYFTTVGFYFSTLVTVLTVYVFLYGRLYLVLSGLEQELSQEPAIRDNKPLQVALASQSFVQIGFLMALPMLMEIGLERGFRTALSEFILMQLQLAPVFFTFSLGTKTHYYGRTLLHGGAKYRPTGRGFVVFHAKFAENYRLYSRSHFVKGIEMMILLIVYQIFGHTYRSTVAYVLITASLWFMVGTWLFAPFLFNPSGFEWQKIVDDWTDWNKWINNRGGIGVPSEKSWESWWEEEQEHLQDSGKRGIVAEILLALRFFIYQYGLVYHLHVTRKTKSFLVYGASWLVIVLILFVMKTVSVGRRKFSASYQLVFRLIKGLIFLTFLSILVILVTLAHMTIQDIIVCIFIFMPTGWGMLLIAQALRPVVKKAGFWGSVRTLARGYEIVMGLLLFTPVAFLAWFPFVSEFQTRMLFNQAFSRGLQISRILGGHRKDRTSRHKE
ncbi:hypothetical protein Gotur_004602 [Gossypium turneri]